jgi:hypothetical protein
MPAPKTKTAQEQAQSTPYATAAPQVDPGPPPAMPEAPGFPSYAVSQMLTAAVQTHQRVMDRQSGRAAIQAVPLLREPPPVAHYKAELLSWLDAMDAYEARSQA